MLRFSPLPCHRRHGWLVPPTAILPPSRWPCGN